MIILFAVYIIIALSTLSTVRALITLEESGIQYESYPVNNFGRNFEFGYEYEAHLQVISQDEYLCGSNGTLNTSQLLFILPSDGTPGM